MLSRFVPNIQGKHFIHNTAAHILGLCQEAQASGEQSLGYPLGWKICVNSFRSSTFACCSGFRCGRTELGYSRLWWTLDWIATHGRFPVHTRLRSPWSSCYTSASRQGSWRSFSFSTVNWITRNAWVRIRKKSSFISGSMMAKRSHILDRYSCNASNGNCLVKSNHKSLVFAHAADISHMFRYEDA